ncbi:MAG: MFS transporter [Anaerolineae bacterium]
MIRAQRIKGMQAFYTLSGGQLVSTVGSGMTRFGLGIWVFTETGDTTAYTLLLFFAIFPIGIGSLFSGPFVDRLNRRHVLIAANIVASLSTLVIALLYFTDLLQLWHLYGALFVNGVANAFILPSLDSSAPLLVPKERLGRASGLTQLIQSMETIVSPSLAGFVIGIFGLGAIFIVDFVTFSASIIALVLSDIPQSKHKTESPKTSVLQDFMMGLRYIRQRPALMYLMGLFATTMFLLPGVAYSLVTPLILTFADEATLGLIISGFGVGSMVGGIALGIWGGPQRRMPGILSAMTIVGLAAILTGSFQNAFVIGAAFFITGIGFVFIMGLSRVIWQTNVEPYMLGRVFALQIAVGVLSQSAGVLLTGPLADQVFEPLLTSSGALADTVGQWIGTGAGRGMALMFIIVGIIQLIIVLASFSVRYIRHIEDQLPDHTLEAPQPEVSVVSP